MRVVVPAFMFFYLLSKNFFPRICAPMFFYVTGRVRACAGLCGLVRPPLRIFFPSPFIQTNLIQVTLFCVCTRRRSVVLNLAALFPAKVCHSPSKSKLRVVDSMHIFSFLFFFPLCILLYLFFFLFFSVPFYFFMLLSLLFWFVKKGAILFSVLLRRVLFLFYFTLSLLFINTYAI